MIFVTGCARSGTSLTTKILKEHGCNLGRNVNTLYENTDIRERILKPYLRSLGCDPRGQTRLPPMENIPSITGLREKVLTFLGEKEPRAYKDAKLTLVWQAFAEAFPEAKWVIVRRDRGKIADSCIRTEFMTGRRTRDDWLAWALNHEHRFERMRAALNAIETWPDETIAAPDSFAPVAEHCGLTYSRQATLDCIDRKLWHSASVAAGA